MGFFSKRSHKKDMKHFEKVRKRLFPLMEEGIINEDDLSLERVSYEDETAPRVIVTLDRLYRQGYLSGLEESIGRFSYLVGMGEGLEKYRE